MTSYNKLLKVSKRVAIILLIAVFSVAGIIACSADATEPSASQTPDELPDPGQTGPVTPSDTNASADPEPEPTFPEDTYYTVYTPFRGENYPTVSYQDTNKLLQYWKEMMARKDNGGRWVITDGDNHHGAPLNGHYYYFDKNFDLVYHRLGKGTLKIRKLVGAVIVKYYRGKYADTVTVGGLYQNLIENAGQYNWKHFSKFMHAGYNPDNDSRKVGDLEILVLNLGFNNYTFREFGVDAYYNVWNKGGYRDNIEYFLGQSPDFVDNRDPKNYALNQKVNLTWDRAYHDFMFKISEPPAWHLEEHPEGDWVSR